MKFTPGETPKSARTLNVSTVISAWIKRLVARKQEINTSIRDENLPGPFREMWDKEDDEYWNSYLSGK